MSATLKETTPCLKQLQVEVPAETVQAEFNAVYREFKRVANVPGFRVGFAPRDLLERYHGQKAREEVIRRLVGRSLDEALSAQGPMDLVGRPQVTDVQWEPSRPLTYTAQLEIAPEVPLGRYKGFSLTRPKAEVTEGNVSQVLEHLRQISARGKEVPPLDDSFAKTMGPYETLAGLKEAVRKDLGTQAESARRAALEAQVLQQLAQEWEFDVPPSLVASQARRLLKERAMELMNQGIPAAQVQEQAPGLTDQAKLDALKQVRLFFILRRIAAVESLSVAEEEIQAKIQTLSARLGRSQEEVRKDLEARDLLDEMAWGIVRRKVIDLLLREANIEES